MTQQLRHSPVLCDCDCGFNRPTSIPSRNAKEFIPLNHLSAITTTRR
ncbi:MAG: hypothetical protein HQL48_02140 [Gammaproteobacteria bacterium]|nr:hypothetical protein [Gammaproteobacteria bacterium]